MLEEAPGKNKQGIGAHGAPFLNSSNPSKEELKKEVLPNNNYWEKTLKSEECVNRFDTLILQLPLPNVQVNLAYYYPTNQYQTVYRLQEQYKQVGLNSVELHTKLQTVTVAISSKILRGNCMQLLCADTLPAVHQAITSSGAIACDYSALLEAVVLRADLTTNVWCTQRSEVIKHLQAYGSTQYRVSDPYRNKQGQYTSVEFHRQVKTAKNKLRVIIYDKQEEVQKDQAFTTLLSNEERIHLLNQVHNHLRIEVNLKSFKSIREYLCIEANTLKKVIYSTNNAVYTIMQTITENGPASIGNNTIDPAQLKPKEVALWLALQAKDFNLDAIRSIYKAVDPKNASRLMQPYQDLVSKYSSSQSQPLVTALLNSLNE